MADSVERLVVSTAADEIDAGKKSGATGSALKWLLLLGAAVGAAALANAAIFYKTPPLRSTLGGGAVRYWPGPQGDIFYKTAGEGPPLLLIHGIGAGCSSHEWREVWDELAKTRTVYALDLLGFGKSDKPDLLYDGETFLAQLAGFVRAVIGEGMKPDVIATSLSGAYAVALAARDPDLLGKLVLVCPTGLEELTAPPTALGRALRTLLKVPVLGTTAYNLLAGRVGVRSYLAKYIYADPARVTDELVAQYHTAAHQPGGDRVLPSFVSGFLNRDIRADLAALPDGPLVVWGREAKQSPVSRADAFANAHPSARVEIIDGAGMLPHEERPEAFLAAVRAFL